MADTRLDLLVLLILHVFYFGAVNGNICSTEACKRTAQRILDYMDPTTDPCDNFYQFTCGKFIGEIQEIENSSFSQVTDIVSEQLMSIISERPKPNEPTPYKNLKRFYSLCMDKGKINSRGIAPGVKVLQRAGGWPVLGSWDEKTWDLLKTKISLFKLGIVEGSIFGISLALDYKNSSRYLLEINPARLVIPREYLIKGLEDSRVQAYYQFIVETAVLFGANKTTATAKMKQSLLFEIELAKLMTPKEEEWSYERMYNKYNLQKLQSEIGWIDWEELFKNEIPATVKFQNDEVILVSDPNFLKDVGHLIMKHPKEVVANHIMWLAAKDLLSMLPGEGGNNTLEHQISERNITDKIPRLNRCNEMARSLNIALSSLYVKRYFDKESKTQALKMVSSLRNELIKDIEQADWMNERTREKALQKASKMWQYIGYGEELLDISKIESYYEGLILEEENFLEVALELNRWTTAKNMQSLRKTSGKQDWDRYDRVTTVNAAYALQGNFIEVPAAILQYPFFVTQAPKYVNYGRMGFIIGHELSHGFDDKGSQFNSEGNLEQWWDEESKLNFNKRKQCIIEQYSSFKDNQTELYVNGVNTQSENIADNAAIKLSFNAYKRLGLQEPLLPGLQNYSQDQLFFINTGNMLCIKYRTDSLKNQILTNPHPPLHFRVNGVLQNFIGFKNTFRCSKNALMNPKHKCEVW